MENDIKRCSKCKIFLPKSEFWKAKNRLDGLQCYCKGCWRLKSKTYYEKDGHDTRQKYGRDRREKTRQFLRTVREKTGCQRCGEKRWYVLAFHHIDPLMKEKELSAMTSWSMTRIQNEIEKCMVLCANCHAEIHYNGRNGAQFSSTQDIDLG